MKKVLVIGASGLVGSRFVDLAKDKLEIVGIDEKTLDITDKIAVEKYFLENRFDTVVNFAAYTNVDGAEKEKNNEDGLCYRLNVVGPKNLAEYCNKNNIFLVHISTDFVFFGSEEIPGPYDEDSILPSSSTGISWYGWTKNLAEKVIKSTSKKYAIIRYGYPFTATNYELKLDWARNLIKLYKEQKLYPFFDDQIYTILFIDDLVDPLVKIINNELIGVFHIASSDSATPFEVSKYLLDKYSGTDVELQKGSMVEFLKAKGRTPRPRLGGLKTEKTQERLGMKFKTWKEMINQFLDLHDEHQQVN